MITVACFELVRCEKTPEETCAEACSGQSESRCETKRVQGLNFFNSNMFPVSNCDAFERVHVIYMMKGVCLRVHGLL